MPTNSSHGSPRIYVDAHGRTRYIGEDAQYVMHCRRLADLWELAIKYDHPPATEDIVLTATFLGRFVTQENVRQCIVQLRESANLMALSIGETE